MHVHNNNNYGFTLNLDTNQPDLVNNRDSTYRINSVTGYYKHLGANQWGYGMGSDATSFSSVSNAMLADITKDNNGDCSSISDCTIKLTFGANIDPKRLPVGSYSTTLTYTATSKPAPYVPPAPDPEPYVPPTPPAPEPPKWTTNGCYYSNGDWHNCAAFSNRGNTVMVVWKDDSWYAIKATAWKRNNWFDYSTYYRATWAHIAILTKSGEQKYLSIYRNGSTAESVKLDLDDMVKVFAFVPVYSRQGNYINFCGSVDTTTHKCEYSDVGGLLDSFAKYDNGFWVGLHAMGCTNVPDESKCNHYYDHDHEYYYDCRQVDELQGYASSDAKKVADTLAEAIGSPCY